MKINQHLKIVLPLDIEGAAKAEVPMIRDGKPVVVDGKPQTELAVQPYYVYSSPLSAEVFRRYWKVFSKTFAVIMNEGLHVTAGPRIAAMAMRDTASELGQLDGLDGVEHGVFDEIKRTSVIVMPTDKGWQQIPLHDAITGNLLSEEDVSEVENILCFFTVISAMLRAAERLPILEGAARLWDARIISSNCSEFIGSLPRLTVTANSGVKLKVG